MILSANTNTAAMNAQRNLVGASNSLATSLQRLSTGSKINSAKDDAAGLQISNRLASQVNGLSLAAKNANDGISMAQTAEGALEQSTVILQRMRDLALQSANGSNSRDERKALNAEVVELKKELDRIANTTTFGGRKLLDGSFGTTTFQVGAAANETISAKIDEMSTQALEGKIHKHSFKFTDLGLNKGAATELKLKGSWNAGRAYVPPEGDPFISNPKYQPDEDEVDYDPRETIPNPDYVPAITEIKARGTYEIDLRISLKLGDHEFPFSLGDHQMEAVYQLPGGTTTAPDLTIAHLSGTTQTSMLAKLDAAFAEPESIMQEMATNINDLNIGVGAFVEKNDDGEFQLTLVADGAKQAPKLEIDGAAITMAVETHNLGQMDLTATRNSQEAIIVIDQALQAIDAQRADLGAIQNRFENTIGNLNNIAENVSAAKGRIQDTDYAAEAAQLSKQQIMLHAGTAILAQANQLPQAVLSLLR